MQEPTTTYLTPEGKLKLETELEDLKTNKRRELAERLNFAIKQGDLSENADYIAAKEDQAFLEGRIRTIEWAILIVMISVVLSAELFNTALEATLDRVSVEEHPLAKIGKDVAAGAVFVCAIGAVIVGLLIFGPRLLALIGGQ